MEVKKKSRIWLWILLGIAGFIAVAVIGGYIWYASFETIDVFETVEFKERGLDGHGQLFVERADEDTLPVTFTLSRSEGLFNGDEIQVKTAYDKLAFLKARKKLKATDMTYEVKNLLVTETPWEELPEKEKLQAYITEIATKHEAELLANLKSDVLFTHGKSPNIWLDYEFEQVYYGFNNMSVGCELAEDPQGFAEDGASFDYCDEMLVVYKVKRNIEEPFYYPNNGEKYVLFNIGGIYVQDGKLVMGPGNYKEGYPYFYEFEKEWYDEQLKYNPHFKSVEF